MPKLERVLLDPDGTWGDSWLFVVVLRSTGVEYGSQCGGLSAAERWAEGFLVPLAGYADDGNISEVLANLRSSFHPGGNCVWGQGSLSSCNLGILAELVGRVPFWSQSPDGEDDRGFLGLDLSRVDQMEEAWVPVTTTSGPGWLAWKNCD